MIKFFRDYFTNAIIHIKYEGTWTYEGIEQINKDIRGMFCTVGKGSGHEIHEKDKRIINYDDHKRKLNDEEIVEMLRSIVYLYQPELQLQTFVEWVSDTIDYDVNKSSGYYKLCNGKIYYIINDIKKKEVEFYEVSDSYFINEHNNKKELIHKEVILMDWFQKSIEMYNLSTNKEIAKVGNEDKLEKLLELRKEIKEFLGIV